MCPPTGPAGSTTTRLAPDADILIRRYLSLAVRLAREYRGRRLSLDDLVGEANLALVEAAHRFDVAEHSEDSFASYAERVIRSHLRAALERAPIVHRSRALERAALHAGGDEAAPRPYAVAVEDLGLMAGPDDDDRCEVARSVEAALDLCGETGRAVLCYVALDGLSIRQAAERLSISRRQAEAEHAAACLTVAGEFRRRGWDLVSVPRSA